MKQHHLLLLIFSALTARNRATHNPTIKLLFAILTAPDSGASNPSLFSFSKVCVRGANNAPKILSLLFVIIVAGAGAGTGTCTCVPYLNSYSSSLSLSK